MLKVEPRADDAKLRELLAEQHESDALEYIAMCDPRDRRDLVELASEVGALAARGGYIAVGVDDRAQPTGVLEAAVADLFDDATLRDKLGRYLPNVELHVGRHPWDANWLVLICVMPHPDGAAVFAADGAYEHAGKSHTAFRRGEFLVRHGSKSERPTQDDITRIRLDAVEQAGLWVQQLDKVADLVTEIGRLIDRERPDRHEGRVFAFGQLTQIPTACERLRAGLALLAQVGGPDLPAASRLAQASQYVFLNQMMGDVYAASSEIARVAEVGLQANA